MPDYRKRETGLAGFTQAADDMVRIISNGLTFGGADRIASALGEQDTAARTAAARERAGIAGDAASMLGVGGAIKGLWTGAKALPKLAKVVTGKRALGAGALGLGTYASYLERQPANAAAAIPAPARQAAPMASNGMDPIPVNLRGDLPQKSMMDSMMEQVARANGGKISLRQMSALSEIAQRTTPRTTRTPTAKDIAGQRLLGFADQVLQRDIAAADANPDRVAGELQGQAAVQKYMQTLGQIQGMNPIEQMVAEAAAARADQEE